MDSVPLPGVMPILFFVVMMLVQAVAWVFSRLWAPGCDPFRKVARGQKLEMKLQH
jgi:hypothetical protein